MVLELISTKKNKGKIVSVFGSGSSWNGYQCRGLGKQGVSSLELSLSSTLFTPYWGLSPSVQTGIFDFPGSPLPYPLTSRSPGFVDGDGGSVCLHTSLGPHDSRPTGQVPEFTFT